jgi:arsenical pump membrane protein
VTPSDIGVWTIAALSTAGVIARPFQWPEAVWAVFGATILVVFGLLPWGDGLKAVSRGSDVYLFLTGMMLLSETARREGLFDWVACVAVKHSKRSPRRMFVLIYGVGVAVTTFLSNDATAVVLTPAVYAATKKAEVEPLPYLFICAFVANAASFVLPISNPANLVLYADHTPALGPWMARFAFPSALSILITYVVLRCLDGSSLRKPCKSDVEQEPLSGGGRTALAGIGLTAVSLLAASAFDLSLGLTTFILGASTTVVVLLRNRQRPAALLKGVSWGVLPLVAGLFVMVEAVSRTGVTADLAVAMRSAVQSSEIGTAALAGSLLALASNLTNNLPAGLLASRAVSQAHPPASVVDALLIGVDLGPNLSVTGSLATILWLTAIRREGETVGFFRFLRRGMLVMPPALALAIGARLLIR